MPFVQDLSSPGLGAVKVSDLFYTRQGPGNLPWKTLDGTDPFFGPQVILEDRWNKLYPYRFVVIDVNNNNKIVGGSSIAGVRGTSTQKRDAATGLEYLSFTQEILTGAWECVLPITPQQLVVQDSYSINTSATMRGVIEEHGGVNFKMISASGTTGIWTKRPTRAGEIKSPSSINSIFSGTISAFNGLAASGRSVISTMFGNGHPNKSTSSEKPTDTLSGDYSTGYFQALYMSQFLERYVQEKKKPENKGWRLVFDMPKQNQSFVVSPVTFNLQQSHQRPNEIMFNFQLKAWKRINLSQTIQPSDSGSLPSLEANLFQRIAGGIQSVRKVLSSATNLIKAVRGDFQKIFNILRQTSLIVKDLGGLAHTAADLLPNIIADAQSAIEESLYNLQTAFDRPVGRGSRGGGSSGSIRTSAILISGGSGSAKAGQALNSILEKRSRNEGISSNFVSNGLLGTSASLDNKADPLVTVFQNPEEYFDLFDAVSVDSINLTTEQQEAIERDNEEVSLINIQDLRDFKSDVTELSLDISNYYGSGDSTFSSVYGRTTPRDRETPLTIEENEVLAALFEFIQILDLLTATKKFDELNIQNPLEYVGGLASESDIDFDTSPSKILVPVPFGLTIEDIAARYLGNPDKWIEISTINNLRSPYIDEDGFTYDLLTNADGRQFTVNDQERKLFLGQKITLRSTTVPPFTRKIINIEEISETTHLITVDGEDNLSILDTFDDATLNGYRPGTVNSQNQIFIPVPVNSEEDDKTFTIPQLDQPTLTKISKVDFLLTDDGDIALNSIGDFRLANGLTNLIQALKLKIRTKRGSLLRHLDYGLGLQHGVSVSDIETGEMAKDLNDMIVADPRFEKLEKLTILLNGSTVSVDISVVVANNSGILPISFKVDV